MGLPTRDVQNDRGRRPGQAADRVREPEPVRHGVLDAAAVMRMQRAAGNAAVTRLVRREPAVPAAWRVQRAIGWSDASTEGKAWNAPTASGRPPGVGKILRVALEGVSEGIQDSKAVAKAKIPGLTPESAKGKAIALVFDAPKPPREVEVLIFLHGYTESAGDRPFAGWRALNPKTRPRRTPRPGSDAEYLANLRQGVDDKDVAPVRDVALDRAEQQLEASGQTQLVVVLPQGGLFSEFGKRGDADFDAPEYAKEIVKRLFDEHVWKDATDDKERPTLGRVSMAGHSGAGATLSAMAHETVRNPAKETRKAASSSLTGDLVLFDAMTWKQLTWFKQWALARLDADLAALKTKPTEKDKREYLRTSQKLRGYYSTGAHGGSYVKKYEDLDTAIDGWFAKHMDELGSVAGCLRGNFLSVGIDVGHEELMRGAKAGAPPPAGAGGLLDAIRALNPTDADMGAACKAGDARLAKLPKPKADKAGKAKPSKGRSKPKAPAR
jgi:hypothetical protein